MCQSCPVESHSKVKPLVFSHAVPRRKRCNSCGVLGVLGSCAAVSAATSARVTGGRAKRTKVRRARCAGERLIALDVQGVPIVVQE